MIGPEDYHTKWSKSDKYHRLLLYLHVESKENYTNEIIYKMETDSQTQKN